MKYSTYFCVADLDDLDVISSKVFEQLMLHPELIMKIKKMGFHLPTPLQATTLPLALRGNGMFDLII